MAHDVLDLDLDDGRDQVAGRGRRGALDFDYGTANPQPSDAFLLGVKRTSACMAKFATAPNPGSVARAAPAKLARLR